MVTALSVGAAGAADGDLQPIAKQSPSGIRGNPGGATQSGIYDFSDQNLGTAITECPQAKNPHVSEPLDRRVIDQVEKTSNKGDDRRSNDDYSCFPQDEVSVDINPLNSKNFVIGANDYRLGTGSSGFHATTNGGKTFYNGIIPFPSVNPTGTNVPGHTQGFMVSGGDPVSVYDRAGVAYYVQIVFNRDDDTGGVTVARSTNGGYTWSRACIVAPTTTPVCGGPGDPRQPGDGVVSFQRDNDFFLNGSVPFDDKEYGATGPRPLDTSTPDPNDRVPPVCYDASHAVTPCGSRPISPDRLYVTWTKFAAASTIQESHSDDQGRSWSPQQTINGSASFCGGACQDNQASVPTVHPKTGYVYVAFENFNTPDENQYLLVRSKDGGTTWEGPFFVSPVFDLNYPRAGVSNRQDCIARGQQFGRIVYTNSCFRSNSYGNVVVDDRSGAFADDLYLVFSDNRNGTVFSSNADIFLFKSVNGGSTWIGPTRVNNDRSNLTAGTAIDGTRGRDCLRPDGSIGYGTVPPALAAPCTGDFGADQWWPWVDIGSDGELNVAFKDRRLDTDSVAHEWPTSRNRPGNYLVWTWGAQCKVSQPDSRQCLAPGATEDPQPTAPVDPGPDPVPGQGNQYLGTLKNFQVSDVPSNYDYSFRAGIFAGDYENIAVSDDHGDHSDPFAINVFTDARNGRSSRNQAGRNPICEQSDIFFDIYPALGAQSDSATTNYAPFLVTPCPAAASGHDD